MSIAEKLQTIAENEQKVYDAGYEKGKSEGGDTETAYNNGFEAGKQAEYDRFWDNYQNYGKRVQYTNAFFNWNDITYNPKYPIYMNYSTVSTFSWSTFADTKVDIELGASADASYMFSKCYNLKTIRKLIVTPTANLTGAFLNCEVLENITIEGVIGQDFDIHFSPLTKESITSIINALSPTASGQTVTFSNTAVTNAFGGSDSEEWLSLRATKSNWTISLI